MPTHYKLLVPGASPSNKQLEVTAPYDEKIIATFETADSVTVEKALATAHQLFRHRTSWLPKHKRIAVLEKAAQIIAGRIDELAAQAANEGGKPFKDSKVEIIRAIDGLKNCAECLRSETGTEIPMGINPASENRIAFTTLEPIGVVVAVSAFNHPFNLIVHQVGPAIAAGCPVIVKPSQDTPISCYALVSILRAAGLPDEWCQALVTSDREVSSKLVTDGRVGFFSFIGSATVGWNLRSQLAPGTRCALEHGGVAPVIVEPDADLDDALPLLAKGSFYHAGQVCVSVQRIFCHQSIAEEVGHKIAALGKTMSVGDPILPSTDIGPLIRTREVERIHDWVNEAIEQGATLLGGGKKISASCYSPTVLYEPNQQSKVSQLEVFGPVVCIYSYSSIEQAITLANALPYAFQASVFTKNINTALYVTKQLEASAVMINDFTAFRVDWMPFAGLKHSGLGVGGIPHTFRDMQIEKLTVIRSKNV